MVSESPKTVESGGASVLDTKMISSSLLTSTMAGLSLTNTTSSGSLSSSENINNKTLNQQPFKRYSL